MKKLLLLPTLLGLLFISGFAQTATYWSASDASRNSIVADKAATRQSFPKEVKLFTLNAAPLRQALFAAVNTPQSSRRSSVISLPNAAGSMEDFEMFEASNFEPALQARFPNIRSFSGKGITDKTATLKLSMSPQGVQTMVFRTGKKNEFIEPYSQDHSVYAVFASQRADGNLPWTCATPDDQLATSLNQQVGNTSITARSGGDLKTMRLAQSVNAEYSNYFGATSPSQVGLVLAAINNTLARCNGVYEKDLALHLNLVAASTNVIYYNPSTDPYTTMSNWNSQLQSTLTSVIGEANYDIGHLFGASGGGGNAGCIGCVCVDGSKGRGYTSPADAIPQGDNFDIDYVVHEIGHQLGANHTFSHTTEGTGTNNKEVGSGITIMGYAGITAQDVAPHSIDIFHQNSIAQIQANLLNKTCPVTTTITNATPVVAAVSNYTIPRSTPFALTGAATDANASDVLTYCWEQNDNATSAQTGVNSVASPTKLTGPNWLSFRPTTSPVRYFPQLATILAGAQVTGPLPGGDAGANIEALSSVARTLNFRLTVRDNAPYRSTAPVSVGQTAFTDMAVTVSALSGPFVVTAPNTAVTWAGGSSQTITWDVAATTAAPVSCANVKISLSTDGGQTFPTVLAASTPNDGTEALTIPNTASTTARIKVEAVGNIFFDISNSNFTITAAPLPNLTINDITLNEGNSGTTSFTFTVSLSSPAPAGGVSFNIATANNTAVAPGDYTAKSLIAQTIPAGSSTYSFTVLVNGDVTVEPTETFFVNVINVNNAVITDGQGIGTITNDDAAPPPNLSINNPGGKAEGNSGTTSFVFTVSLSGPAPAGGVSFDVATRDAEPTATATVGSDYVSFNSTGFIPAGSSSTTVTVLVNGDALFENNEFFVVDISNATNANIINSSAFGSILNDDAAPGLTINDITQVEGNAGTSTFSFTVSLSAPSGLPATFQIATADGSATAGSDYVARPVSTQTIPAGSTTYTFDVTVNGDNTIEGNETFDVNISNANNAVITDAQGVGTITNDDAADPCATDATPPVITPKNNPTVFLNANGQVTVQPTDVATVTDNCTLQSVTVAPNSFSCANITGATTYQPFVASNSIGNQNAAGEQGMDFRVNATNGIVITQLGAFDHQANGLIGTQPDGNGGFGIRVAIFNKANQSIVSGLDVVITGNGDAFSGNYRYKNIPAVTLPPGDYVVLAKGYNANELSGNSYLGGGPYPQGDNASGAITYLNTAYYDENDAVPGFTYPSVSVNTGTSSVLKSGTFTYALSQNNVVTVTAKDVAGNQSQVNVNVMVVDTMYVLATKNITVNLNSSGQASIQPRDVLQSYKNKCGIDVISSTLQVSPSNFTCADVGAATLSSPYQPFIAINATGNQNAAGEQGMDFRVNATSGIVITQLGAFDHQANGLIGTQPDGNGGFGIRVAIFNKANQSIVSGLDVVITGNGDAFSGNYRYKNIPAVTLPPGDYVVLAKGYNANELNGNSYLGGGPYPQGDNAGGAITYLNTAYYDENDAVPGFTYPTVSVNTGTSSVLKSGTFTYKTKMATGTLVTLTATDVYGNQKQATANVTVTDFNHVCTPAAKAAPVMAAAISTKQPKELVEVEKVSAYPNPSNGVFNVLLSGYSVPKLSLEILDGNGKVVAVKAVTLSSKTQTQTVPFDLGNRASGMYWIRVVSATGVQTTKVVVNR